MTWGDSSNISTDNLNNAGDSPAAARSDLKDALDELTNVINGLNTAGGAAKLDAATTKVIANSGIQATADLTLTPTSEVVKVQNFINLAPVAYANLPGSPAQGDVAFLTTDGAGTTKNQLVFYNGSAWKYVTDATTTVVAS
tara:strand:- start:1622 stop:2044 length:423 start_codon:yes stop_codon:yes gene_type:complete